MSDEAGEAAQTESQDSAEAIMAAGAEVRKRRGRPPGSKNRTREPGEPPRINQSLQADIFASSLIALFAIIGLFARWFGYEKYEDLTMDEAREGGKCLIPIAAQIGWLATAALYLSFPAWVIAKFPQKYRKKVEPKAQVPTTAQAANGSRPPSETSVDGSHRGETDADGLRQMQ